MFEPSIVVLDACVLYPFHLRNIVVQAAVDHLVEARWTDAIHDEWMRNLAIGAPPIPLERLQTTRRLMTEALPNATVRGYEHNIARVDLPDPSDRHVVAAGIAAGAAIILTWNLRDFPSDELRQFDLQPLTPDAFLAALYDSAPDLTVGTLSNARRNLSRSRVSATQFIEILAGQRLIQLADRVRSRLSDL